MGELCFWRRCKLVTRLDGECGGQDRLLWLVRIGFLFRWQLLKSRARLVWTPVRLCGPVVSGCLICRAMFWESMCTCVVPQWCNQNMQKAPLEIVTMMLIPNSGQLPLSPLRLKRTQTWLTSHLLMTFSSCCRFLYQFSTSVRQKRHNFSPYHKITRKVSENTWN